MENKNNPKEYMLKEIQPPPKSGTADYYAMRKIIRISIILLLLHLAIKSYADYAPPGLFDMVGASDVVLLGEIIDVKKETFLLQINEKLAGDYKGDVIEIYKYKDWLCSGRWASYEKGQKEIVFLLKSVEKSKDTKQLIYKLRSAGSEGEIPVEEQIVYCHNIHLNGIPYEQYGKIYAQKLVLKHMLSAIKDYNNCFRLTRGNEEWPFFAKVEQICSEEELLTYERTSVIHKYLSESTKMRINNYGIKKD